MSCITDALAKLDPTKHSADILSKLSEIVNLPDFPMSKIMGEIDKIQSSEVLKSVTGVFGASQDFGKEDQTIANTNLTSGDVAAKRSTPIPLKGGSSSQGTADHGAVTSSTNQDYPESSGSIDSIGNWTKVNKITKQTDWVHNSGSMMSFFANGDVVVHIRGNKKEIIEGDYVLEVGGNLELAVGKSWNTEVLQDIYMNATTAASFISPGPILIKSSILLENP